MELNLLLLPLLGGYFVYLRFHGTAYYARQCSSQRLLFNSAIIGLCLLVTARLVAFLVEQLNADAIAMAPLVGVADAGMAAVTLLALLNLGVRLATESVIVNRDFVPKAALGVVLAGILAYLITAFARTADYALTFITASIVATAVITLLVLCIAQWIKVHTRAPYESLLFRIALVAHSFLLVITVAVAYQPTWETVWNDFSPYPQSGTALLAFGIGLVAIWPLNRLLFPHDVAIHRLYTGRRLNAFDCLMYEAMLEDSQIQFTLKEGKVYVGWVLSIPPHLHQTDTYVEILPVSSGYRQAATKRFKADAYLRFQEQGVAAPVDRT